MVAASPGDTGDPTKVEKIISVCADLSNEASCLEVSAAEREKIMADGEMMVWECWHRGGVTAVTSNGT
jgi:homoserine acetyltransferase